MNDPVLYVEDGPDDVFLMQRVFKKVAPHIELQVITNGQDAADFFDSTKENHHSNQQLALVILDLNLPGRSGLEVLEQIRKKSSCAKVPVVLFSASNLQSDIDSCYLAGCNAYIVKPTEPERLKALITVVHEFWLKENRYSKNGGKVAIIST